MKKEIRLKRKDDSLKKRYELSNSNFLFELVREFFYGEKKNIFRKGGILEDWIAEEMDYHLAGDDISLL
jgi:hypothetical protein